MNADFGCVCDGVAVPGGYDTSTAMSDLPGTFGSSRSKTRLEVSWSSAVSSASAGIEVTASMATPAARMACFMVVAPFPGRFTTSLVATAVPEACAERLGARRPDRARNRGPAPTGRHEAPKRRRPPRARRGTRRCGLGQFASRAHERAWKLRSLRAVEVQ